jgi:hypothetical protein
MFAKSRCSENISILLMRFSTFLTWADLSSRWSCPGRPITALLSLLSCFRYRVLPLLYRMSCPGCPANVVLSSVVLSQQVRSLLSRSGQPAFSIMSRADLSQLFCSECPFPAFVLSPLSYNGSPVQAVLSILLCYGCPVLFSCPDCSFLLSCSDCHVLVVLFLLPSELSWLS